MQLRTVVTTSIGTFSANDWNRCFPGDPENAGFYSVCERAGPAEFEWFYAAVFDGERLVAAVPAFGTTYRLDTTVQGGWKRVTNALHGVAPQLMSLRLMALGSPVAEICHLGFAPEVASTDKSSLLARIVGALQAFGAERGYRLFGVKDAPEVDGALWNGVLMPLGFARLPGLPTAVLDLPYGSLEDYFASLSRATRKDMRRKIKTLGGLKIEQRRSIDDVAGEVAALYEETVARSDLQFEHLPPGYFPELLCALAPNASVILYWANGVLVAFNLILEVEGRLIDKYIGMNHEAIRTYNLYFNSWLWNVRYCIERKIPLYQSGQAVYGPKLRLGCRLQPNLQYFRHANSVVNAALRQVAKIVRHDRFDPALAALSKEAS